MLSLSQTLVLGFTFVILDTGVREVGGSSCAQVREGFKIEDNKCVSGIGCYTEYRFQSRAECQKILRGQQWDLCQNNPCRHGGACTQISQDPGFKCRCEGTGFHGQRCQRACPKLTARIVGEFPFECIVV